MDFGVSLTGVNRAVVSLVYLLPCAQGTKSIVQKLRSSRVNMPVPNMARKFLLKGGLGGVRGGEGKN